MNKIKEHAKKINGMPNSLTSNGRYKNFVQDLETKWRKAYRITTIEQAVSNSNDIKYHVSKDIEHNIDKVLSNINERNPVKLRDYTPKILVQNGVKDLPIYENPSHIRKNILTVAEAKKIRINNWCKRSLSRIRQRFIYKGNR